MKRKRSCAKFWFFFVSDIQIRILAIFFHYPLFDHNFVRFYGFFHFDVHNDTREHYVCTRNTGPSFIVPLYVCYEFSAFTYVPFCFIPPVDECIEWVQELSSYPLPSLHILVGTHLGPPNTGRVQNRAADRSSALGSYLCFQKPVRIMSRPLGFSPRLISFDLCLVCPRPLGSSLCL